jgi:hypothetical protein
MRIKNATRTLKTYGDVAATTVYASGARMVCAIVLLLAFVVMQRVMADETKYWVERAGDVGQIAVPLMAFGALQLDTFYRTDARNSNSFVAETGDSTATKRFLYQYATTLSIAYTLKFSVNETRPNGGDHSFPSGHTASAFAGAAFIQSNYGWKWGIPAYAAASFVGWSRVYSEKHWTHDVLAGAALAVSVNHVFDRFYKPKRGTLLLTPTMDLSTPGIKMQMEF